MEGPSGLQSPPGQIAGAQVGCRPGAGDIQEISSTDPLVICTWMVGLHLTKATVVPGGQAGGEVGGEGGSYLNVWGSGAT